jgi:hypothetical protein
MNLRQPRAHPPLSPPAPAERLLRWMLPPEDAEAVLGDFAELFAGRALQHGLRRAQRWYWNQLLHSAPWFIRLRFTGTLERRFSDMLKNLDLHNKRVLWIGLAALLPALVLIVPGSLQSLAGYYKANEALDSIFARVPALALILNPIILLGGLLLAFTSNVLPAVRVRFERQTEGLTGTITLRPLLLHWLVAGASVLFLAIILAYALVENADRIPIG